MTDLIDADLRTALCLTFLAVASWLLARRT